jgi:hypothetical protein
MIYKGGCHCGRIAFEVEGEIEQALDCNCSLCAKRGALYWFVERDAMTLLTPEDDLATYTFNTNKILHRFCPTCGVAPFGEATNPATGKASAAINVRCLDDLDLSAIKVLPFDGRSL